MLAGLRLPLIVPLSILLRRAGRDARGRGLDRAISVVGDHRHVDAGIRLGRVPGRALRHRLGWSCPAPVRSCRRGGWQIASQLVLPVAVLVLYDAGYVVRMVRGSMIEVMNRPYIRTASSRA